jgi:hypothetical protein
MPSKAAQKLLDRMRKSRSGWKRQEIDRLYEGYGFVIEPGGNHDKVSHPDYPQLVTSLPRHGRAHEYVVTQAIKNIDKFIELEREKETQNE